MAQSEDVWNDGTHMGLAEDTMRPMRSKDKYIGHYGYARLHMGLGLADETMSPRRDPIWFHHGRGRGRRMGLAQLTMTPEEVDHIQ